MRTKKPQLWLLFSLLVNGCGSGDVAGTWSCVTRNPNGTTARDVFTFNTDGSFTLLSGAVTMTGSYDRSDKTLMMVVTDTPRFRSVQKMTITGTIRKLTASQLEMKTVSSQGMERLTTCKR